MKRRPAWRGISLVAVAITGLTACIHRPIPHDYVVDVGGTLVDGARGEPIEGARVTVKAGDQVIYDGVTDEAGKLAFTYRTTVYRERRTGAVGPHGEGVTVELEVDAGEHGIVRIPVTIGRETDLISLGTVELRQIGGKEH